MTERKGHERMPSRCLIAADTTLAALIHEHCSDILASPNMQVEARCFQHGSTTVLAHSAQVAAWSLAAARGLRMPVNVRALARGALLHDYFGYDWHVPGPDNHFHGFTHPFIACRKATRDFGVGPLEQSIIRTHMFPLVPLPPTNREALLVCAIDTALALQETIAGLRPHAQRLKVRRS